MSSLAQGQCGFTWDLDETVYVCSLELNERHLKSGVHSAELDAVPAQVYVMSEAMRQEWAAEVMMDAASGVSIEHDPVNHPRHYVHASGVECITVTEHMTFLRGNAVKYLWRAGSKGGPEQELEDLKKSRWYLDREISNLEAKQ